IHVKVEDGMLEMVVNDTGCGVAATVGPRLFDRFYHLSTANPQVPKGFGVGLWLVKSLVELLGGAINYTSREGQGTTFTIRLPNNPVDTETAAVSIDETDAADARIRTLMRTPGMS